MLRRRSMSPCERGRVRPVICAGLLVLCAGALRSAGPDKGLAARGRPEAGPRQYRYERGDPHWTCHEAEGEEEGTHAASTRFCEDAIPADFVVTCTHNASRREDDTWWCEPRSTPVWMLRHTHSCVVPPPPGSLWGGWGALFAREDEVEHCRLRTIFVARPLRQPPWCAAAAVLLGSVLLVACAYSALVGDGAASIRLRDVLAAISFLCIMKHL